MELSIIKINLEEIASNSQFHSPKTNYFKEKSNYFYKEISNYYANGNLLFEFSEQNDPILFPFTSMGNINSTHLFGMNELIIFAYYLVNVKGKNLNVLDLGANLGLHSIILSKFGAKVISVEPAPSHFAILESNLKLKEKAENTVMEFANSSLVGHKTVFEDLITGQVKKTLVKSARHLSGRLNLISRMIEN